MSVAWRSACAGIRHFRAAHGGAHASAVVGPRRVVSSLAIIAGMWWWGFDFGQIFGGFNRKEVEARLNSRDGGEQCRPRRRCFAPGNDGSSPSWR
jgi:hypothetical protein